MRAYPHLKKAPIREAILDIAVEPLPGLTVSAFRPFAERVHTSHPDVQPIRQVEAQFAVVGADVRSVVLGNAGRRPRG